MKSLAVIRASLLAVGLGVACGSAPAEPTSSATHQAATAEPQSAHVQLAAADHASKHSPTNTTVGSGSKKPTARVTTCRCGDQLLDRSDDQSDQPQD